MVKKGIIPFTTFLLILFLITMPVHAISPDWSVKIVIDNISVPAEDPLAMSGDGSITAGIFGNTVYRFTTGGTPLWNYSGNEDLRRIALSSGGKGIVVTSGNNNLAFLDDYGRVAWSRDLPDHILALAMTDNGESVTAGGMNPWPDTGGNITRFSDNGTMQWNYRTPTPVVSLVVSDNGTYTTAGANGYSSVSGTQDPDVYFLDDNGRLLWSARTRGGNHVAMDPSARSVAVGTKGKNMVTLFDHDGIRLFTYLTRTDITDIAISPDGEYVYAAISPALSDNKYEPAAVICLNRQGSLVWEYSPDALKKEGHFTGIHVAKSVPVIALGASTGSVSLIGSNGTMIWEYPADELVEGIEISDDGDRVAVRTRHSLFTLSQKTSHQNSQTPVALTGRTNQTVSPDSATRPSPTRSAPVMPVLAVLATGLSAAGVNRSRRR